MKHSFLKLSFVTVFFIFLSHNFITAQKSFELPEIKGSYLQVYQGLTIEIGSIKRLEIYQPVWHDSGRPRGRRIVAESGYEIALVHIKVKKLGDVSSISISDLFLIDSKSQEYEAQTHAFLIGKSDSSEFDPNGIDYELPVVIPKNILFSAVQLRQFTVREIQPFTICQKITFDVSQFDW